MVDAGVSIDTMLHTVLVVLPAALEVVVFIGEVPVEAQELFSCHNWTTSMFELVLQSNNICAPR